MRSILIHGLVFLLLVNVPSILSQDPPEEEEAVEETEGEGNELPEEPPTPLPANVFQNRLPPPPPKPDVLYDATWESLDTRPLPAWYDEGKIGVIVHYGIYSVIGVGSEWFWWSWQGERKPPYLKYMGENFKPSKTYSSFLSGLTASFYNPAKWAELFEHAGARYAIIAAKHLDGYCMWPSPYCQHWNSMESGPMRDVVGDFIFGVRQNSGMKAGIQYSLMEWFNPLFIMDKNNNFSSSFYPATKVIPEMRDLVERYQPDIMWMSGDWDAPDWYWNSTKFIQYLYNESPVWSKIVVNDRWGKDTACQHGGYLNCGDNYSPHEIQARKFEHVTTMDKFSWGHRRNAHVWDVLKTKTLVKKLVETVSCGGNLLINVGATAEGLINPIYEDRLLEFGKWLDINGEGIYGTTPWKTANDTSAPAVWYTKRIIPDTKEGILYALALKYPTGNLALANPKPTEETKVILFGFGEVKWTDAGEQGMEIEMPSLQQVASPPHGWVLRISHLANFE